MIHNEKNSADDTVSEHINDKIIGSLSKKKPILELMNHRLFTPILYAISGGLLFFSLVVIFNTYVLRLKVEKGVVNALIETMVAPASGYITDVYVGLGTHVKKGTPLLKIDNIDLERELQLARVQVDESKLNVSYYRKLLKNEQQRLKIYKKIGSTRVTAAQTLVNMSLQDVMTSQHNLERFQVLNKKHYISNVNLEAARSQYVSAQEKLKNAQAHEKLENHSLNAVSKGMYFTGTKTEGIERDLYAELSTAKKRVKLNDARVKIYENLINKLTLVAPFDGVVTQILKSAGNTTDTIKPLIFIEKIKSNKTITVYLTQDEIIHIGASEKVKIYIPSSGKTYHGRITEINRTDGFIDVIKAQYRWRDFQIDRSAMVTIALQQSEQNEFDKQAFPGLPATIYFSKKSVF